MERLFGRRRGGDPVPDPRSSPPASTAAPAAATAAPPRDPRGAADGPVVLAGRYELGRLLGEGGEASVRVAQDLLLHREVAVKLFRRQVATPSEGRLEQMEARVGAALNHYALTTLFDTGVGIGPDGTQQLYMVMEFVPGETLTTRLRRGPMEVSEACWLGFDLAEGLDYMHQTGFLHRDVKPSNILISGLRSVRPVVAKLTDFGIAARVGEPDLSEFTIGTAAYLSPEQVEGLDARPESDTYSLGLVLLEAITGRPEFPGSVTRSAFARLDRDPRIPSSVPPRTGALLRRMTQRRPEDRISLYDAAVELQQVLVDDLLRRRGEALPATGAPVAAEDLHGALEQGRAGFEAALRLAAAATGASRTALLLLEPGQRPAVAAEHGWDRSPIELERVLLVPAGAAEPDGAWAVVDARADAGLAQHPLVTEHGARAVAAAPLRAPDGAAVGLLIACSEHAGTVGPDALGALRDAAEVLTRDLALRLAVRRVLFPRD